MLAPLLIFFLFFPLLFFLSSFRQPQTIASFLGPDLGDALLRKALHLEPSNKTSSFYFCYYCYIHIVLFVTHIVQEPSPTKFNIATLIAWWPHITATADPNFRASCDFLNKFYSFTITVSSRFCNLQFCRNHQLASPTSYKATSIPTGYTYCYAYLNTISMHAKPQNPKLIYPLALSSSYPLRQYSICRISSYFFFKWSLTTSPCCWAIA